MVEHNQTDNVVTENSQLTEYQAAQACWLHHDNFQWYVGGLLIVGNFVFWGSLMGAAKVDAILIGLAATLVTALMSVWILYANQVRQIYLCKIDRLQELEIALHMEQNRRFDPNPPSGTETKKFYRYVGPSGWLLNLWIYRVTALGGSALGLLRLRGGWGFWALTLIAPVALFVFISCKLACNERVFQQMRNDKFPR